MRNVSMKTKLIFLSIFFVVTLVLTNLYQSIQFSGIKSVTKSVAEVDLPMIRRVGTIDMYHEGFQGLVYKSFYLSASMNPAEKEAFLKEFADAEKIITEQINEIQKIELDSLQLQSYKEVEPAVYQYITMSKEIVNLVMADKKVEAESLLQKFNEKFDFLEEKLAALNEQIAISSEKNKIEAIAKAESGSRNSKILVFCVVLLGIGSSIFIIKNLMSDVGHAIENLSQSVHDVQNSSQKMSLVSRQMSSVVDKQASSITQSATAMDEISAMIKNNDQSAKTALQLSESAKESANTGKQTMEKMLDEVSTIAKSYDEIEKSVKDSIQEIKSIIQIINEISTKTEVINDIVFQTKLLSFNASVEAARAGESGKGFAVVAEEVGNLAQMSGNASNEISSLLKTSQERVTSISEQIAKNISSIVNQGQDKVKSGEKVAGECVDHLDQILEVVIKLDQSINEITVALNEQSTGVEEVNVALRHLEQATIESTDMSNKSKETSNELMTASHSLRSTIQELRKNLGAKKNYDVPDLEKYIQDKGV